MGTVTVDPVFGNSKCPQSTWTWATMPSDDERDSKATKLKDRDGFFAWKRTMRLVAMDKGDVYGIFDEDGTKGTYAAIPVGAGGAATKRKWSDAFRLTRHTVHGIQRLMHHWVYFYTQTKYP